MAIKSNGNGLLKCRDLRCGEPAKVVESNFFQFGQSRNKRLGVNGLREAGNLNETNAKKASPVENYLNP
jgi:hypothetical protein